MNNRKYAPTESGENNNYDMLVSFIHDLKTPVNVILSASNLIKHYNTKNKGTCKSCNIIEMNCYRLLRLVEAILESSKNGLTHFIPEMKLININHLVKKIIDSLLPSIEHKDIKISFDFKCRDIMMEIDQEMAERIIINLVSNAIKYSPSDSTINIAISRQRDYAQISIRNKGHVITESEKASIFNKYKTLDERRIDSNGLGLFLTKSLVDILHGKITLSSKKDQGNTFTVSLPIHSSKGI